MSPVLLAVRCLFVSPSSLLSLSLSLQLGSGNSRVHEQHQRADQLQIDLHAKRTECQRLENQVMELRLELEYQEADAQLLAREVSKRNEAIRVSSDLVQRMVCVSLLAFSSPLFLSFPMRLSCCSGRRMRTCGRRTRPCCTTWRSGTRRLSG